MPTPHDGSTGAVLAEARLRLAQEAGGVGLWEWDVRSGRVQWDATCAAMFGTTPEDFGGTLDAFAERTHPDDLPGVYAALQDALARRDRFESAYRAVRADGTVRHLLSRGQVATGSDDEVESVLGAVVDVTDLRIALDAEAVAARLLTGLADVALELAAASSVDDLVRVVVGRGLAVLGADGGAVCVRDDAAGVVHLSATESLGERVRVEFAQLPLDGPLPGSWVARTGQPVFLPDERAGLAFTPAMQVVYDGTGRKAWAVLPLRAGGRLLGSLVVSWTDEHAFPEAERELLAAFAAQCAQALDRIQTLEAERAAAEAARSMSEALQRSLLTSPPQPDHLHLVVRYRAAAEEAQIGGDWYDAFVAPDGATNLVIGDVTGHDRDAAARMGQVRNLLRATAYALPETPADVLCALERTMHGLAVDALATLVLARLEQTPQQEERGVRLLRWTNAGHTPPLLVDPDGTVRLLETPPDLLVGLLRDAERTDHAVELAAGSTLLLYTDGLVERREQDLEAGVRLLVTAVERLVADGLPLDALCDAVLAQLLPEAPEDDVALLAVRLHPQDRPRPAEAGDEHVPQGRQL